MKCSIKLINQIYQFNLWYKENINQNFENNRMKSLNLNQYIIILWQSSKTIKLKIIFFKIFDIKFF